MPADFPEILGTEVKNTSGMRLFFPYLGAHGKMLDPDEVFLDRGDLVLRWSRAGSRAKAARNALTSDLREGRLTILNTPRLIDLGAGVSPALLSGLVTEDGNPTSYDFGSLSAAAYAP